MTLTADFRTAHGAVLRSVRPADTRIAHQAEHSIEHDNPHIVLRSETRIFTVFPERTSRIKAELRDSVRRRLCILGMCAPTSVFLALAAWYVAL